MKAQYSTAAVGTSMVREPRRPMQSDIDALAQEIFARLNEKGYDETPEELEFHLARAARTLARPSADTEAVVRATLLELPENQRDVLLLNASGLTYKQIAQQQGRAQEIVLKDLTTAYVRLRMALYPPNDVDSGASE